MTRSDCIYLFLFVAFVAQCADAETLAPPAAMLQAVYQLPAIPLREVRGALPKGEAGGAIELGSIGSDMFRASAGSDMRFWMITDRGPNGQVSVDKDARRTLPTPHFNPLLLLVQATKGNLEIKKTLPLVGMTGQPASGRPSRADDEPAYDANGAEHIKQDPNGIDPEGLVRMPNGSFWISEEYGPSLLQVSKKGQIMARFVPQGFSGGETDYPVIESLPSVFRRRQKNRGFEGLAVSSNARMLYAVMESPLENPDKETGHSSRNVRILVFDPVAKQCAAEFLYRLELPSAYGKDESPHSLKISAACWYAPQRLLIVERTNKRAKVFAIDLRKATNLMLTEWHAADGSQAEPTLESLNNPISAGINTVDKSLVVDLGDFKDLPGKIEGVSVLDEHTIAVSNDNDFNVDATTPAAKVPSIIAVLHLTEPLY
jgi:hypothetical protein